LDNKTKEGNTTSQAKLDGMRRNMNRRQFAYFPFTSSLIHKCLSMLLDVSEGDRTYAKI
jgi:hypothetical protein